MPFSSIAPLADVAAVALGSLFALLLWTARRGNHRANRWLAACSAALALLSAGDLLEDTRWMLVYPQLAHTTDWLIFVVGPCVWLYVRRLTMNAAPSGGGTALNFLPAALAILLLLPFHLLSAEQQRSLLTEESSDTARHLDPVLGIAVVHILVYWLASLLTLRTYARGLEHEYSSVEQRRFRWLAWVLSVSVVMWLFWLLGLALETDWARWLDRIAVPLGLYVLAFAGLRQPSVFVEPRSRATAAPAPSAAAPDPSPAALAPSQAAPARYERSGLDPERAAALRAKLDALMDLEKPWLENDLTLTQLAQRLHTSSHHLSQLLNEQLGVTFFDYVNRRRVLEVQRCLADPAYASQALIEVALAAGFNSKAAFNVAFKKHTGLTPSQFRFRSSLPAPPRA